MRGFGAACVAGAAALALVTGASAATPVKDPSKLALRTSDFPGGATIAMKSGPSANPHGRSYAVDFRYRTRGRPNELSHAVSVLRTPALARATFREAPSEIPALARRVQLPQYGDEQHATFHVLDGARLIVRKGTVVWFLEWQTIVDGSRELTRAEAVAEMKRYGAILKRRVGRG